MSKSRLEWKVGLFVFVCLALLGVLLLMFDKGTSLFRPTMNILMRTGNVSGLKTQATVLMAGVQVGSVSHIQLSDDGASVTITLRIYKQYQIHNDATFSIETSGFLGDQYVSITPREKHKPPTDTASGQEDQSMAMAAASKAPILQDGDVVEALPPFDMQEALRRATVVLGSVGDTASNLNSAIDVVHRQVLNDTTLSNLSAMVINFRLASETARTAVASIELLVRSNSPALSASVSNLALSSGKLREFADGLNGVLATNGAQISEAVSAAKSSAASIKTMLDDVQAGKGPAGTLLKNEQLAANVSEIASNLSITTSNLNRLGLWGVLWHHKPPKTKAPVATLPSPKGSSD
jgi:phospholipid/cholesterol/gamma-HCH transport system substrate-binding protein